MNEAETRAEQIESILEALEEALLRQAFAGEL